jgi:hypothetical protein
VRVHIFDILSVAVHVCFIALTLLVVLHSTIVTSPTGAEAEGDAVVKVEVEAEVVTRNATNVAASVISPVTVLAAEVVAVTVVAVVVAVATSRRGAATFVAKRAIGLANAQITTALEEAEVPTRNATRCDYRR